MGAKRFLVRKIMEVKDILKKQVEETKKLNEGFKQVGETIKTSLQSGIKGLIKGTQ